MSRRIRDWFSCFSLLHSCMADVLRSVFWSKISRFKGDQDDLFLLFMSAALEREDLELFCMVLWLVCKD